VDAVPHRLDPPLLLAQLRPRPPEAFTRPLAFPTVDPFCMARLCGRARRATA
jgi:hypothetical protein